MPELVDVSAAFKNCAFHGIASHLLAYSEVTAELGILEQLFNRPKGESALTDLFGNAQAFEEFILRIRANKKKNFQGNELEGEAFEKVLIIGMALRNYLKQILLSDKQVRENLQIQFITMVQEAKSNIQSLGYEFFMDSIAQTENGVMAEASKPIFTRKDLDTLSDEDLAHLWQSSYADAYANKIGELDVTISYRDIAPLCQKLRLPLTVFAYVPTNERARGRILAAQALDEESTDEKKYEPLTLLLHEGEAHYHVELPEDNPFTKQFKADNALYGRVRENTGALELGVADKNGLTNHSKLLFLTSVLSTFDQLQDARVNFLNSIRRNLSLPSIDVDGESFCVSTMDNNILMFGSRRQVDNDSLNSLINDVACYMHQKGNSVLRFTGLTGLKRHCFQDGKYGALISKETDKVLNTKIKALRFYQDSPAFAEVLSALCKLQLTDGMVLKLAVYSLFTVRSNEHKINICNNLIIMASHLEGAADPALREAALIVLAFFAVASLVIGVATGTIGLALGLLAIGALCSGVMYYNGTATKDSAALMTFVKAYQSEELNPPPTFSSGKN